MRLLFLGDIVGTTARETVIATVPRLIKDWKLDFVLANADNASHGFGVSPRIADALFACGVDVITGGNHIMKRNDIIPYIERESRLLRPANFAKGTPGKGYGVFKTKNGQDIGIVHMIGNLFVKEDSDNAFAVMEDILPSFAGIRTVFVDFHAEVTAEKMSFAHAFDGRVTGVFGTHTHVPTADLQFFTKGTLYLSDLGMCGDYNSSIGFKTEAPIDRFKNNGVSDKRLELSDGNATLCGLFVETDVVGKVVSARTVRMGGNLMEQTDLPVNT